MSFESFKTNLKEIFSRNAGLPEITEEMCEFISDHLDKIYEEEYNECLD